jgi:hypothetical protein
MSLERELLLHSYMYMGPLVYLVIVPSITRYIKWLEQTPFGIMMDSMVCDSKLFTYKFSFELFAPIRADTLQDCFSLFHGWQVLSGHWFPRQQQQLCTDSAAAVSQSS